MKKCIGSAVFLVSALAFSMHANPGEQAVPESFVWEQVSACQINRQEWFAVARTHPGEVGDANRWERRTPAMTFSSAMLDADARKMEATGFFESERCCREWGVYEEAVTRKLWVFNHVRAQMIDARFMPVQLHMCCEEVFNRAGFPPGRDCRALRLSDGRLVTRTANRTFVPLVLPASPGSVFDEMEDIAKGFPVERPGVTSNTTGDSTSNPPGPGTDSTVSTPGESPGCRALVPAAILEKFKLTLCRFNTPGQFFNVSAEHWGLARSRKNVFLASRRRGPARPPAQPEKLLEFDIRDYHLRGSDPMGKPIEGIGDMARATGLGEGGSVRLLFRRGGYEVEMDLSMFWLEGESFMLDAARQLDAAIRTWPAPRR